MYLTKRLQDHGGPAPAINPLPPRLQRSRKRGLPTPPGAVYVGRPTLWANPFALPCFGHAKSIQLFRRWLSGDLAALGLERLGFSPAEVEALARRRQELLQRLPRLAGRPLQCWCPASSPWCHAQTLLQLANMEAGRG